MIIEGKAQLPKVSSATSVYPAVILNILLKDKDILENNTFVYLQVFCPSVMSGSIADAKFCATNWIEAPVYPHDGEETEPYDYKQGGIVLISYQDGNVNSPQFVRYVQIEDSVIAYNKRIIDGALIPIRSDIFDDIMNPDINLDTIGLEVGIALLEAIRTCAMSTTNYHTYGYIVNNDIIKFLTIYRCGQYGTELIYKNEQSIEISIADTMARANSDYIETAGLSTNYNAQNIIRFLYNEDKESHLISVVNKTISEFERDTKYKTSVKYDRANLMDKLFWYTKIAGYIFDINKKYDMSSKISPTLSEYVGSDSYKITEIPSDCRTAIVINNNYTSSYNASNPAVSLYHNTMMRAAILLTDEQKDDIIEFIDRLWYNICKNDFFIEKLKSRYAMIVSNLLISLQQTYNVKSLDDKMLLICAVIATAFPTLEETILTFDVMKEFYSEQSKSFVRFLRSVFNTKGYTLDANYIAKGFRNLYFEILDFPNTGFDRYDNPYDDIYKAMLRGINYIENNYATISNLINSGISSGEIMPGDFAWPIPGCTVISSRYGEREDPKTKEEGKFHEGVDISGNSDGKAVVASRDGKVTYIFDKYAKGKGDGYGNNIKIAHNDKGDMYTRYAHLLDVCVKVGDIVKQGQIIGHCDNTGKSTGSHLHFEIWIGGQHQDPLKYISPNN